MTMSTDVPGEKPNRFTWYNVAVSAPSIDRFDIEITTLTRCVRVG
jgi:hypothetical protein